jgi:hypothetical protein
VGSSHSLLSLSHAPVVVCAVLTCASLRTALRCWADVVTAAACRIADANEAEIADLGGLEPIIAAATRPDLELQGQAARALRNLSVRGTCGAHRFRVCTPCALHRVYLCV